MGIFTEVWFTPKHIHDNVTHASGNLIVCPSRNSGSGKICLMSHYPAGKITNGLQIGGEFLAQRLG